MWVCAWVCVGGDVSGCEWVWYWRACTGCAWVCRGVEGCMIQCIFSNFFQNLLNQGNKTLASLCIGAVRTSQHFSKFLKNFNASNVTKSYQEQDFKVLFLA